MPDATDKLEKIVEEGTKRFMKMVDMGADAVMNRPIGAEKLSKQEQKIQYREKRIDPAYQQSLIKEFIETRGYPKGVVDYIDYVEEMMKDA